MAIDVYNPDHRHRLARALSSVYSNNARARKRRANLINIYKDSDSLLDGLEVGDSDLGTLLNHFQQYVKGHLLTTAFYLPKFAVSARTAAGVGFDKRIEQMLGSYVDILGFHETQRLLALDSAFGWAVAKVTDGPAPKGITAPVAPRVYRINPDNFIIDPSAASFDEATWAADLYLVPLEEAQNHEGFDPVRRMELREYRDSSSGARMVPVEYGSDDLWAEPYVRLVDVYIPAKGCIYTYECNTDTFENIAANDPIGMRMTPVDPYAVLSLLNVPNQLEEIARLSALRGLHLVSNEMLHKGINQARDSQRNPLGRMGDEQAIQTAIDAGDGTPILVEQPGTIGLYSIPGPDPSILQMSQLASGLFSQQAGNLEVALGQSTGAQTARQTEALISQISASQAIDRRSFEIFLSEIGRRLATLAFHSQELTVESVLEVPGTKVQISRTWGPPEYLKRVASIDTFRFDVVPYSTAMRTPEERLAQLHQGSMLLIQMMQAKAQGLPLNLDAVMETIGRAYENVPELKAWWSGQEPTPAEKTANTYTSFAQEPQGSDVNYHGVQEESGAQEAFQQSPGGASGITE